MNASPARYLRWSNTLTYIAIVTGLLTVFSAKEFSNPGLAGIMIGIACLADSFDGAFARLFRRTELQKRFGAQLDSLTDTMVFGAVPVAAELIFLDFPSLSAQLMWLGAALVYLIAVVTRLGCFDVEQAGSDGFVGLPTTVAGMFWCAHWLGFPEASSSALFLVLLAGAMLAPIRIPRMGRLGLVILLVSVIALIIAHTVVLMATW
jgi:phosphatidylserine synthase